MFNASNKSSFFSGFLIGGATGCVVAAVIALIISGAPVPFVEKVQKQEAPVEVTELDGKDPNTVIYDNETRQASADTAMSAIKTVEAPTAHRSAEEPTNAAQSGVTSYRVQAGAFRNEQDAEKIRTDLAFLGIYADVTKSTDAGVTLFRVVMGPFETAREANDLQHRLIEKGYDAMVIRNR